MFLCSSAVLCSCFLSLSSVTDLKMSGWNQMAALQLPGFRAALQTHRCRSWISDLFHLVHAQSKKQISQCIVLLPMYGDMYGIARFLPIHTPILIYGVHFHGLCHCSVTKTFNFKCDSWARCPFVVRIFRTFKFSGTISQESAWAEVVPSVLLIQWQFGTIQTLVVTVHMDLSGQQLGVKASTVHSDYVHFLFIRGFIVFWHSSWFKKNLPDGTPCGIGNWVKVPRTS